MLVALAASALAGCGGATAACEETATCEPAAAEPAHGETPDASRDASFDAPHEAGADAPREAAPDASDGASDASDGASDADADAPPEATCGSCAPGWDCCDGVCVNLVRDPLHCGGCGVVCDLPHSLPRCDDRICLTACEPDFGDCDGNLANGCETPLVDDVEHCGACNHACVADHATSSCKMSQCEFVCDAGWVDCDDAPTNGCEVSPQTDPQNCGQCGHACSLPHAVPGCVDGACAVTGCFGGYFDCNQVASDGCEAPDPGAPPTPVRLSPAAGAYTGSLWAPAARATLRPTLSWTDPDGGKCARTFDLQLDDSCTPGSVAACTFPSPEVSVTAIAGTSWAPTADLAFSNNAPLGRRYYWRVRACDARARCSAWSTPHWVEVGRVEGDTDGDGYGDVASPSYADSPASPSDLRTLLGAAAWPGVKVITSGAKSGDFRALACADLHASGKSPCAVSRVPDTVFYDAPFMGFPGFGSVLAPAGDWNADGFDDLLVTTENGGGVALVKGGPNAFTAPDVASWSQPSGSTLFGVDLLGRVDLDGDGWFDLVIADGKGVLRGVRGGPSAATAFDGVLALGVTASELHLARAGDVDGDGCDDLLVGVPNLSSQAGKVFLVRGDRASLFAASPVSLQGTAGENLGVGVAGGFDVDADGAPDLFASAMPPVDGGASSAGRIYRLTFAQGSLQKGPSVDGAAGEQLGRGLRLLHDATGDGLADLAAGAPAYVASGAGRGELVLYAGAASFAFARTGSYLVPSGRYSFGAVLSR